MKTLTKKMFDGSSLVRDWITNKLYFSPNLFKWKKLFEF